jgi:hypothetical protein
MKNQFNELDVVIPDEKREYLQHPLECGKSLHHLFTKNDIKKNLIKIYGKPKSEKELLMLMKKANEIHERIPVFSISENLHNKIHRENNDHKFISWY